MMPLTLANPGEENTIVHIAGKPETKKHLEDLGFHVGGTVRIVSELGGNVIVDVKNTRIALDRTLASKIGI
ncbi:MAG: ferrous iron transport protein A [Solobacterium sp.]|nr:ferrous iron transport protein A [Solobacterium sp.]